MALPTPVSQDDKTVTFSDGSVDDKSKFSPASLQKLGTQIAEADAKAKTASTAPFPAGGDWVKDMMSLPTVTPAAAIAPGTVDLSKGIPSRGPLVGQGTAPAATPAAAPGAPASRGLAADLITKPELAPPMPAMVPMSQTETTHVSGVTLSPQLRSQQDDLYQRQQQSVAEAAAVASKKAKDDALAITQAKERQDAVRADFAKQRTDLDSQVKDQMARSQAAVDDLKNSKMESPEPQGGERVINSIAMALGAFGASLTGGPNTALQIIEGKINRKVAAQKAELDKKGKSVDLEKNQLAFLMSRGLDLRQAEAAMRQVGYEEAQQELATVAAKYGGDQATGAAAKMSQDLEARKLAAMADQEAAAKGRTQTQTVTKNVSTAPSRGDLKDLQEMVLKDPALKQYRDSKTANDRFRNLREAGAEGSALADFIAGDGGLKQGSFSPTMIEILKKRGLFGQTVENLRSKFAGGVDPTLLNEIQAGLEANRGTAAARAAPSIQMFRGMGAPDAMVIGGQTSDDVAAQLGGKRQ